MVQYKCKSCNYLTVNCYDYKKHELTQKHISNITKKNTTKKSENTYTCKYCGNIYKSSSGISRHRAICVEKEKEIESHKRKELETENKHKTQIIELLTEDKKNLIEDKKSLTTIATSSTGALSFLVKNYSNAPNITKFDNFSLLKYESTGDMANMLAYKQKKNIFGEYITEILLEHYKKENPSEQSIWNSDVSRLSYIVKDTDKKNISVWIQDKKGNIVTEYAIDPLLKHVHTKITENQNRLTKKTEKTGPNELELEIMENSYNLLADIENGESTKDILKCLASHFYITTKT